MQRDEPRSDAPPDDLPAQPALHELVTVLRAPAVALSAPDGQVRAGPASGHGVFTADRRVLSRLEVEVLAPLLSRQVGTRLTGAGAATFSTALFLPGPDAYRLDPALHLVRSRSLTDDGLREHLVLHNRGGAPVELALVVTAAADMAALGDVKQGLSRPAAPARGTGAGAVWEADGCRVELAADPSPTAVQVDPAAARLRWTIALDAGGRWDATIAVRSAEESASGFLPRRPAVVEHRPPPPADPADQRLDRLLRTSLADLDALLLADPDAPGDAFLAAGSPWFLTLFGRDALWCARMLLPLRDHPLGLRLAAGTLRALARRQGTADDPLTEEQPGKVLHEVRRGALRTSSTDLPPVYYGSVDATALWVCLLVEAWRAGMAEEEVAALVPNAEAALAWLAGPGDADGDGFVEYRGSAHGIANQGWKDSEDGIRWADGRIAERPLALCEVQGYAHAAAVGGAALLAAFDRPGAERWLGWASALAERFRSRFWVDDPAGPYPAVGLDGHKRPVDGPASNMAHLLGTGLLTAEEAELVAARLGGADLDSGYGLRTLSSATRAYNPLSYHCGSVWPHDTAIAVLGLAAEGHHGVAGSLSDGLLAAAEAFGYRLPELYGGTSARDGEALVAYPASCRPQAWTAAGAVAVVGYRSGSRAARAVNG